MKILATIFLFSVSILAQIPTATHITILKAEDPRRYDKTLEDLLKSPNEQVRIRAALAAGRIGNEAAIPALEKMIEENLKSPQVLAMAAFAIGEIESIKGAEIISLILKSESGYTKRNTQLLSRAVEAAGKIAAANASDPKSKELGAVIVRVLEDEMLPQAGSPSAEVIRLGLSAVLRARPAGAEETVRKFLASSDPSIVADALNTLARLRAKTANSEARDLLKTHRDPVVRANAARLLGAAEDKEAVGLLVDTFVDAYENVRISAIRSLASIRDPKSAIPLGDHAEYLLQAYKKAKKPNFMPKETAEFAEVATALGRIFQNSSNPTAIGLLEEFRELDGFRTPEIEVALARVSPGRYVMAIAQTIEEVGYVHPANQAKKRYANWRVLSAIAQGIGTVASMDVVSPSTKENAVSWLKGMLETANDPRYDRESFALALPDIYQALALFKTADLGEIARTSLQNKDVQMRATAAGILADLSSSKENVDALKAAFTKALLTDKMENDAQFSILDALYKLDKKESVGMLLVALNAQDYLLRKKAFQMLADKELQTSSPGLPTMLENARKAGKDKVLPYNAAFGTKLGQVLNTDADYRRALSRKNGSVKAVLTTEKGTFTINFLPEDAPLTVDNFIKLARAKYFDGLEVHRVVPNFVMQDGDPRGDGNGGPGWSIRCEVNTVPYERGAVGMALSGKDTGGSQWFVTHSPQPHLDGGYTVFGKVNETDIKVVDNIVRGDKVLTVRIVGK